MNKYSVTIQRFFDYEFEIEAENEEDAENQAEELFDDLQIYGHEMWATGNNRIIELESSDDYE